MEHYTIYGKEACAFCDNAKAILTQRGKDFTYNQLDTHYTREEFFDLFSSKFDVVPRTFPQIILTTDIGDTYLGGFTELREHLNN